MYVSSHMLKQLVIEMEVDKVCCGSSKPWEGGSSDRETSRRNKNSKKDVSFSIVLA